MRKAKKNNDLFYKRLVSGNPYCYPVVQFKRINGYATIICIGEGTESIGGFFSSANERINPGEKKAALEIETVKAEKTLIQTWESNFTYTIRKYLPLSNDSYAEYQKIDEINGSYAFIAQILKANISLFAKSIGIHLDREISCIIRELEEKAKAKVKYKNHTFVSFDLKFKTNVSLPNYIGLGIGVSHGFGTVARVKN